MNKKELKAPKCVLYSLLIFSIFLQLTTFVNADDAEKGRECCSKAGGTWIENGLYINEMYVSGCWGAPEETIYDECMGYTSNQNTPQQTERTCDEEYRACTNREWCETGMRSTAECKLDCSIEAGCGGCRMDSDCAKYSKRSGFETKCNPIIKKCEHAIKTPPQQPGTKPTEQQTKCGENQEPKEGICVCKEGFEEKGGACIEPQPISAEECAALRKDLQGVLNKFQGKISTKPKDFWKNMVKPRWDIGNLRKTYWLGKKGLHHEDGYTEPIRTGDEVELYNRIKNFIASNPNRRLDIPLLLQMGLESSREGDKVNLQTALFTIHNVVRFLARPGQWSADSPEGKSSTGDYGHPPDDLMYPVFRELRGYEATTGKSLVDIMKVKRREEATSVGPKGVPVDPQWTYTLFDPKNGVFKPLPGAIKREWNGGGHYYFWIGAVADTTLAGRMSTAKWAAKKEMKEGLKEPKPAAVQAGLLMCGANFGEDARP